MGKATFIADIDPLDTATLLLSTRVLNTTRADSTRSFTCNKCSVCGHLLIRFEHVIHHLMWLLAVLSVHLGFTLIGSTIGLFLLGKQTNRTHTDHAVETMKHTICIPVARFLLQLEKDLTYLT